MRLALLLLAACGSANLERTSTLLAPSGDTETSDKPVAEQPRAIYTAGDVRIQNDFPGGAFASFKVRDDGVIELGIRPENEPINDSAWYAFRLFTTGPDTEVRVVLRYEGGTHRYHPKVRHEGSAVWTPLPPERVAVAADRKEASLRVQVSRRPLVIAAQEVLRADILESWIAVLASRHAFVRPGVVGRSAGGRELPRFEIAERPDLKEAVVLLGRQHPPETTGSLALMAFAETLCADTELARRFRARFAVVVLPLLNPDGVDAGFWRHNLHGVDLNRDWRWFRQPETRAASADLERLLAGKQVRLGIDFHSTMKDVFYVLDGAKGPAEAWIEAIARARPDYTFRLQPVPRDFPAAMNWIARTFGASVVTYEVGDDTDRTRLHQVAATAAEEMMKLLLAGP